MDFAAGRADVFRRG
jgi:hypothetical protein